jgi:hypothetical protein
MRAMYRLSSCNASAAMTVVGCVSVLRSTLHHVREIEAGESARPLNQRSPTPCLRVRNLEHERARSGIKTAYPLASLRLCWAIGRDVKALA